jgi:hypothetical protein
MLEYYRFMRGRGLTPREVDELSLDELFWLPVIQAAWDITEERLMSRKQEMLQYG